MDKYKNIITKEELAELPSMAFEGEIHTIDKIEDVEAAVNYLKKYSIIGFDSETKPSFKKGQSNSVCLLQLSTREHAFLFRLNIIGLLPEIAFLLASRKIKKIGVGIHDDIVGLKKLFAFKEAAFVELQTLAQENGIENISLKKLCGIVLGGKISKKQQVSNWEKPDLSEGQKKYAATDAWAALRIYEDLCASYDLK
ncbi:MAG: 3'-5' exonuclease [Marinifilaceae bacterium]